MPEPPAPTAPPELVATAPVPAVRGGVCKRAASAAERAEALPVEPGGCGGSPLPGGDVLGGPPPGTCGGGMLLLTSVRRANGK